MKPTPEQEAEIRRMIAFLNSVLAADPEWVSKMFDHRPACNDAILNHPSIQAYGPEEEGGQRAGLMGLINGFHGTRDDGGMGFIGFAEAGGRITKFVYTLDDKPSA